MFIKRTNNFNYYFSIIKVKVIVASVTVFIFYFLFQLIKTRIENICQQSSKKKLLLFLSLSLSLFQTKKNKCYPKKNQKHTAKVYPFFIFLFLLLPFHVFHQNFKRFLYWAEKLHEINFDLPCPIVKCKHSVFEKRTTTKNSRE